jgi:hypothetical protein
MIDLVWFDLVWFDFDGRARLWGFGDGECLMIPWEFLAHGFEFDVDCSGLRWISRGFMV